MKFAYIDPPYLGCCARYEHFHPDGRCWDEPETHRLLIVRANDEFPDGWAMSMSSPSLRTLLPMCPPDVRVMPWVKPFAVYKPNVNPAYAWEPVIVRGGRKRTREQDTVRDWIKEREPLDDTVDWVSANITLKKGLCGAKPAAFCTWIFEVLGMTPDDELHDLFPGTGIVTRAWKSWRRVRPLTFEAG